MHICSGIGYTWVMATTTELISEYRSLRLARRNAATFTEQFAAEKAAAKVADRLFKLDDAGDTEAAAFISNEMVSL